MDKYIPELYTLDLIDKNLYCLCGNYNCIISISLDDFSVEYAGKLEQEYAFQICLSGRSSVFGNHILYCPYHARNIHCFDVEKRKDNIIAGNGIISDTYWGFLQDRDFYYAIPMIGDSILKIDFKEGRVTETIDISNVLNGEGSDCHINEFTECDGYQYKDKFYVSLRNTPFIVELDFKNDIYQAYRLEGIDGGCCAVAGIGELLYIYNKDHYIVTYNIDKKTVINKVKVPIKGVSFFYITLVVKQEIYFYQMYCPIAVKYNTITRDAVVINFNEKLVGLADKNTYKPVREIENGRIVLISGLKNMVILDLVNGRYKYYKLKCDINEIRKEIVKNPYFPDSYLYEYTDLALSNYIKNNAFNKTNTRKTIKTTANRVGNQIYSSINGSAE